MIYIYDTDGNLLDFYKDKDDFKIRLNEFLEDREETNEDHAIENSYYMVDFEHRAVSHFTIETSPTILWD